MTVIGERPVGLRGRNALTARQACYLRLACDTVPDVYPSPEGHYVPDDAWPLSELPDWVLFMANPRWRQRFLMLFGEIGARAGCGETSRPRCFAESVALWIALARARWIADDVGVPLGPGDVGEDWDQLWKSAFGDDLGFRFIWHRDATDKMLAFIAGRDVAASDPVSQWHPYRWWDSYALHHSPA
ncbi:MAG TPA: hypothetical protein VHZ97_05735 [Pseudonocardiaceae bacterium]|jgi:hypothetical protein|nr:hypothetical protein [Pseudonocardiaceae bacterium]